MILERGGVNTHVEGMNKCKKYAYLVQLLGERKEIV